MKRLTRNFLTSESGAIATIIALLLPVFMGMTGMAFDYGSMFMVQSELKKAAEAGALAGARALVPYVGNPPQPNWSNGQMVATSTVKLNEAEGQLLTNCTVTYGYWSTTTKTFQSSAITPTVHDVAAIRVVVAKNAGSNGGPFKLTFLSLLPGIPSTKDLSGTATAVLSFPRGMPPGSVFPIVAAKSIVDLYWTKDPPVSFKIGSGYSNGQWTSFLVNDSSASYVAGIIANNNPTTLYLGDNIWLQPGVKASNYGNATVDIGKTLVIPLVNPASLETLSQTPIIGFVAFKVEDVSQSSKYIQGHFDKSSSVPNAKIIGSPTPNTLSSPNPPYLVE